MGAQPPEGVSTEQGGACGESARVMTDARWEGLGGAIARVGCGLSPSRKVAAVEW